MMMYPFTTAWLTLLALLAGVLASSSISVDGMWAYLALGVLLAVINGVHTYTSHAGPGYGAKTPPLTVEQFLKIILRLSPEPEVYGLRLYVANPTIQRVGNVFRAFLEGENALVIEAVNEESHGEV